MCYAFWRYGEKNESAVSANSLLSVLQQCGLYETEIKECIQNSTISEEELHNKNASVLTRFEPFLDPDIRPDELRTWFETQPPVYLTANPGKNKDLRHFLAANKINFDENNGLIATTNSPILQQTIDLGYSRIQDKGTAQSLLNIDIDGNVWDCCCGAGGKSLFIAQNFQNANMYCSDVRDSILANLQKRFQQAALPAPKVNNIDLSEPKNELLFQEQRVSENFFDFIVADVPCSGSGTWRHNPEAAHFFKIEALQNISSLQRKIVANAIPFLKSGGHLIYITCSVLNAENVENAAQIAKENDLEFISSEYTGGYAENCDYIFRTVFRKE